MKADPIRIKRYLTEIRRYSFELNQLILQNEMLPDSVPLKAAKYLLIELAEAMRPLHNLPKFVLAEPLGKSSNIVWRGQSCQ